MANVRQPKKVVNGKFVNEVRGRSSIGKVGQAEKSSSTESSSMGKLGGRSRIAKVGQSGKFDYGKWVNEASLPEFLADTSSAEVRQ